MPRLWNDTIEAHRREVRDAILHATATLVAEHGLTSVTMSQIAERAGIGRATLYKYFPGVEEILVAWHERKVADHLGQLREVADDPDRAPSDRLRAVLGAYARIHQEVGRHHHDQPHGADLTALLHGHHVTGAHDEVAGMIAELVVAAAADGDVRADVDPDELARYCLNALQAAEHLPDQAAVERLVRVTMTGLRTG